MISAVIFFHLLDGAFNWKRIPPCAKRVLKWQNWSWDLPIFGMGKWDPLQWDWDFTTGNGIKTFENRNGISLLCQSLTLYIDTNAKISPFLQVRK